MPSQRLVRTGLIAVCLAVLANIAWSDELDPIRRLAANGQASAALADLDRLLAAKPKDPALRFLKGVLLSDAQRTPEALQVFEQLTQDYPELPEPHNNLAVLYAARGEYERARLALGEALRANPQYAVAQANLGDVLLQLAQQSYQRAIGLAPADAALPARLSALRKLTEADGRTLRP